MNFRLVSFNQIVFVSAHSYLYPICVKGVRHLQTRGMYSFEGEFRRKPQQTFVGASKKHERDELLHRVHLERIKREASLILPSEMAYIVSKCVPCGTQKLNLDSYQTA